MLKKIFISSLAAIVMLLVPIPASAITVDFRDASYSGYAGSNLAVFVVDGITITMQSINGLLSWSSEDGFGICGSGYEEDEVESPESILLSFSDTVNLTGLTLYDLFEENDLFHTYNERGSYAIDGGPSVDFYANPGSPNGALSLALPSVPANSVFFTAPGIVFDWFGMETHEFALGGLTTSDIPEPASVLLLGMGLLGLAGLKKKRF